MDIQPVSEIKNIALEKQNQKQLFAWQNRLLPWMIILPSVLILVFIFMATKQLNALNAEVNSYKTSELDRTFFNSQDSSLRIPTDIKKDEFLKLYMLAKMDEQLINKRYSQGGALLTSRLYTKYLGFFTGMILAIVGAVFIISKLTESTSTLEASMNDFKTSIVTSSPGIIFGVLGTGLMLTTILKQNDIDIKDVATYLNAGMYQSGQVTIEHPNANSGSGENQSDSSKVDSMMKNSTPFGNKQKQ